MVMNGMREKAGDMIARLLSLEFLLFGGIRE